MAVVLETTVGNMTIDLFVQDRPVVCKNFLKLCKIKYYNFSLFHSIQSNFIAQCGRPVGADDGQSIFGVVNGSKSRYVTGEKMPRMKHHKPGLVSMVNCGDYLIGSQFFITLGSDLHSIDEHIIFGEVTEGQDVLLILNETICDQQHRPYKDIRITHTVILDDPYEDIEGMIIPPLSPEPNEDILHTDRIAADEEVVDNSKLSEEELRELNAKREAEAQATILEIVGDIPDKDVAPPENVLFVCKLNPVTNEEDLQTIFGRFGKILGCEVIRDKVSGDSLQYAFIEFDNKKSCEDAYLKMDNVLIDDRRIHVDFSQSVAKIRWRGKGRGVVHLKENGTESVQSTLNRKDVEAKQTTDSLKTNSRTNHSHSKNTDVTESRKHTSRRNSGSSSRHSRSGNKQSKSGKRHSKSNHRRSGSCNRRSESVNSRSRSRHRISSSGERKSRLRKIRSRSRSSNRHSKSNRNRSRSGDHHSKSSRNRSKLGKRRSRSSGRHSSKPSKSRRSRSSRRYSRSRSRRRSRSRSRNYRSRSRRRSRSRNRRRSRSRSRQSWSRRRRSISRSLLRDRSRIELLDLRSEGTMKSSGRRRRNRGGRRKRLQRMRSRSPSLQPTRLIKWKSAKLSSRENKAGTSSRSVERNKYDSDDKRSLHSRSKSLDDKVGRTNKKRDSRSSSLDSVEVKNKRSKEKLKRRRSRSTSSLDSDVNPKSKNSKRYSRSSSIQSSDPPAKTKKAGKRSKSSSPEPVTRKKHRKSSYSSSDSDYGARVKNKKRKHI